jgi:hypothetical protein
VIGLAIKESRACTNERSSWRVGGGAATRLPLGKASYRTPFARG